MKTAPFFLSLFMVLVISSSAKSAPFQDSEDGLANQTFRNLASNLTLKAKSYTGDNKTASAPVRDSSVYFTDTKYKNAVNRLKQQATSLKEYARANHFNTEYCFLVDMSV